MRISFLLRSPADGGGNRVIARYARWLLDRGHQVQAVSIPDAGPSLIRQAKDLLRGRRPLPRIRGSVFDGTPIPHRPLSSDRPIEDRDVPDGDVVIATWWETAYWVARLSPTKGRKVYLVQGYESSIPGQPAELADGSYRLPLHKLVVSRWLADLMRDKFGDPGAVLVPNAVDCSLYQAPARDKQARPTAGFIFALESIKGSDLAAAALEQVRRQLPDLRVLAFGRHPPPPETPLPPWVELTVAPTPAQVVNTYRSCDVWLFSSRMEGYGLPILEAMACRTPVVGTPAGAAPELLGEGGGRLIAGHEPSQLAAAVIEVLGLSTDHWRQMSQQALQIARRHDWDVSARTLEAALERLCDQRQGATG